MESSVSTPAAAQTPPDATPQYATVDELKALAQRVENLEGQGVTATPANPGENLTPTPTNPELTPDQPGVEPGDAPAPSAGDNAPTTTDPGGDTSKLNAPQPPAPEPEGANVTTNPGTAVGGDQGVSQVETPDPEGGEVGQPGVTDTAPGIPPVDTATSPTDPQPTQPATEATDDTLYVYVGEDPAYTWPAGYVKSDLQTPDGKPLYRFTDDVVGEEAKGAVDGTIGIYADEVLVPTPAS